MALWGLITTSHQLLFICPSNFKTEEQDFIYVREDLPISLIFFFLIDVHICKVGGSRLDVTYMPWKKKGV